MLSSAEAARSSVEAGEASDGDPSYYKAQYEQLEAELADFQASSRELESELERDIEAAEKRERQLQERIESLGYEVEEWKVCARIALLPSHLYGKGSLTRPLCARPSTSNQKPRPTMHRILSKKKSQRCGKLTGRCN